MRQRRVDRRLVGVAVGLTLLLASAAYGQAPTQDSVRGSAITSDGRLIVSTDDAHSGPAGENPGGRFLLDCALCNGRFHDIPGTVTCLNVHGNRAVIGVYGPLEEDELSPATARDVSLVEIVDNGSPGPGHDTWNVQTTHYINGDPGPFAECPASLSDAGDPSGVLPPDPNVPWYTGPQDFTVTDAQPPATYTQCRQAGWVKYGYVSHGQCNEGVHQYARQKCIFERAAHGIAVFRAKYGLDANGDYAMRHCVRLYTGF